MDKKNYKPWNLFQETAHKYPQNIFFIQDDKRVTYGAMLDHIEKFSKYLEQHSCSHCGVYLPNSTEFLICMFAINKACKIFIPLSFQLKGLSLFTRINNTDMELLITNKTGYEELARESGQLSVNKIIVLEGMDKPRLYEVNNRQNPSDRYGEDVFGIFFTSGSTAQPKGIITSNYAITGNALAVAHSIGICDKDLNLIPRSFTQTGTISGDILMAVAGGAGIVVMNDLFHPSILLKMIQDLNVTIMTVVSTVLSMLIRYPRLGDYDCRSLHTILYGGLTSSKKLAEDTLKAFPLVKLIHAYGISEASARVTHLPHEEIQHAPAVGRPLEGISIKVFKEDGTEAATGEMGEFYVKSDYIMNGYYKNDEATRAVFTEKGFRSKDVGYKDERGLFYLVSRSDDLIIQGGNNVYPIEIEELLSRHEGVEEVYVFGVDDERLGKRVVAYLRCSDKAITDIQLFQWCRKNMEMKKVPKEIYLVDTIPKNEIGKIQKKEIMELYAKLVLARNAQAKPENNTTAGNAICKNITFKVFYSKKFPDSVIYKDQLISEPELGFLEPVDREVTNDNTEWRQLGLKSVPSIVFYKDGKPESVIVKYVGKKEILERYKKISVERNDL